MKKYGFLHSIVFAKSFSLCLPYNGFGIKLGRPVRYLRSHLLCKLILGTSRATRDDFLLHFLTFGNTRRLYCFEVIIYLNQIKNQNRVFFVETTKVHIYMANTFRESVIIVQLIVTLTYLIGVKTKQVHYKLWIKQF